MKDNDFAFNSKVISIGEIHGIDECAEFQLAIIEKYLVNDKKVTILLERDFEEQSLILEWLETQKVPKELLKQFEKNKTSAYLRNQYDLLKKLSELYKKYSNIELHCMDISFKEDTSDNSSKVIRNISDEDEFDLKKEEFIISKLIDLKASLEASSRIIWIAGNMHCSKTARYYSLTEDSSEHIKTSTMWLHDHFGCESIFTLPFSGNYSYQKDGEIVNNKVRVTSNDFDRLLKSPFTELKRTTNLNMPNSFKESYDWIFGIQNCTASSSISRI